jgi:DNA repair exonuclease SbcCD ATPase subunit
MFAIFAIKTEIHAARRVSMQGSQPKPVQAKEAIQKTSTSQAKANMPEQAGQSTEEQMQNKKTKLQDAIISIPGTESIVKEIQKIQQNIRNKEEQQGIPSLQQKVDEIRHQACIVQQENKAIHDKLQQAEQLQQEIGNITQGEQQKINTLNTQLEQTTSEEQQQKLKNKINEAQQQLKEKPEVQQRLNRIESINADIYKHPEIAQLLEQAQKPAQQLRTRYDRIQNDIDSLEQQLNKQVNNLQEKIAGRFEAIQPIIGEINTIQDQLENTDPCRQPENGVPSWENLLL